MSGNARRHLRKNLKATTGENIQMSVTNDISNFADDIYPLYLQVFERSKFHFEKLTKDYFLHLGERMPDNLRLMLWHRDNKLVAFNLCIAQGEDLFSEYLGFDYAVAIDLHLYHYAIRDMIVWAMAQGYKRLRSSGLNYDPKLHLGHRLDPLDLYVRHTSPFANAIFKRLLPWLEPVRYDATLKKFPNYADLW
jgi:predicted N-acyltransferase